MPGKRARVFALTDLVPVQLRAIERLGRLRIRHVLRTPAECRELLAPALADCGAKLRIAVVCEVLKWRARGPLLALEEHRDERSGQDDGRPDEHPPLRHERGTPLTERTVADLIVVLEISEQPTAVEAGLQPTMATLPETRVVARVAIALHERHGEVLERA